MRRDCSFCRYRWNSWLSLFKLSFHTIVSIYFMNTRLELILSSTVIIRIYHTILLEKNMNNGLKLTNLKTRSKTANLSPLWHKRNKLFYFDNNKKTIVDHTINMMSWDMKWLGCPSLYGYINCYNNKCDNNTEIHIYVSIPSLYTDLCHIVRCLDCYSCEKNQHTRERR
jgi:hypothetical protein